MDGPAVNQAALTYAKAKRGGQKKDIFIFLSAFSLWRAVALLSVKVADVSSFFFSDFYKTYGTARLLFNFMFSLQEARLLLPGQRGLRSK